MRPEPPSLCCLGHQAQPMPQADAMRPHGYAAQPFPVQLDSTHHLRDNAASTTARLGLVLLRTGPACNQGAALTPVAVSTPVPARDSRDLSLDCGPGTKLTILEHGSQYTRPSHGVMLRSTLILHDTFRHYVKRYVVRSSASAAAVTRPVPAHRA